MVKKEKKTVIEDEKKRNVCIVWNIICEIVKLERTCEKVEIKERITYFAWSLYLFYIKYHYEIKPSQPTNNYTYIFFLMTWLKMENNSAQIVLIQFHMQKD